MEAKMDEDSTTSETSTKLPPQKPTKKDANIWKSLLPALIVLLLMAASAGGAYFWQQAVINSNNIEANSLRDQVEVLKARLAKQEKTSGTQTPVLVPNEQTSDNVKASIESGNYAALLTVFADKVNYAIAASDGIGVHTAAQAVEDLKYLDSATGPWDFNLPKSELDAYASSTYYAKYFPASNVIVGKSADSKVVSLLFNQDGKITTLFMSADASLLKD